ncbi:peptidylprolyl isomerase, partial [Planctomycetota bacterium]|nr:peptidylprolyl isomerase [Planctomycetota bacterium]
MFSLKNCLRASALLALTVCLAGPADAQDDPAAGLEDGVYARFQTNHGEMIAKLHHDKTPMTVGNFVGLTEGTLEFTAPNGEKVRRPYYDGLVFHRVISGFMIQGGDPQGTGMGGPGYQFADEINPSLRHTGAGILSMANAGPATNGSQFFVTLGPTPHLDGKHAVFGELVRGQNVLTAIGAVATGAQDRPTDPVVMEQVTILRVGEAANAWHPENKQVPDAGEPDPARVPSAEAEPRESLTCRLVVVQYAGCTRQAPYVTISADQAVEIAG